MARKRRSGRKQNKLIFELGLLVILVLVAYILMTSITMSIKTPIVTTEELWKWKDSVKVFIRYGSYNSTTGELKYHQYKLYNLSDIASYFDGYLYISIPTNTPPDGYDKDLVAYFAITLVADNKILTHNDLAEKGLNKIEVFVQVLCLF